MATLHTFFAGLTWIDLFEAVGCVLSILGSELISRSNTDSKWRISRFLNRHAKWGWASYLGANICMIIWGSILGRWMFVFTQAWFLKTSIVGIRNHLWPAIASHKIIVGIQSFFRPVVMGIRSFFRPTV